MLNQKLSPTINPEWNNPLFHNDISPTQQCFYCELEVELGSLDKIVTVNYSGANC